MSRRTKRTDADKRALLAAWRASGLSKSAFCRDHGLPWKSLSLWQSQFEPPVSPAPMPFVDVVVVPDSAAAPLVVELAGCGHRIHVPPNFDATSLRRLIGALC